MALFLLLAKLSSIVLKKSSLFCVIWRKSQTSYFTYVCGLWVFQSNLYPHTYKKYTDQKCTAWWIFTKRTHPCNSSSRTPKPLSHSLLVTVPVPWFSYDWTYYKWNPRVNICVFLKPCKLIANIDRFRYFTNKCGCSAFFFYEGAYSTRLTFLKAATGWGWRAAVPESGARSLVFAMVPSTPYCITLRQLHSLTCYLLSLRSG